MHSLTLIPWQNDFMEVLADMVAEFDAPEELVILFPHNRPRRHLKALLAAHPGMLRPVFMPQMTSIADFVTELGRDLHDKSLIRANQLDLVETLYGIVTDLQTTEEGLLSRLPALDREAFLPWGTRLAKLLDDLLRQDLEAQDLSYMEGEVSAYAAGLLEQLRAIHEEYLIRLEAKGWTTPGLDAARILNHLDAISDRLEGKTVLAAGFYALSGSEDRFFKHLWQAGILFPVIHADPALATYDKPHWTAAEHSAWVERWHTRPVIPSDISINTTTPDIRFCEGFDRHSQLSALTKDMEDAPTLDRSAVVLPDENALMPVLHHLPEKEPNISMGYPLQRTSLARLLETLLSLQETRLDDGRYYWRDLVALIRHPYLRLLGPEDKPLRRVFHLWEAIMREGETYLNPHSWQPPYGEEPLDEVDASTEPLRLEVLARCLTAFEEVETLSELGDALNGLATLLHTQGEKLWHTYLIDAECLFRLTNSVIPQLKSAEVSHTSFSRTTLYSILRSLLSQERVSFEPDPLGGLQVLGVLETRLLHFKRLYVLDAVEERLPGSNPHDPLLPDPLRNLLGLPDSRERDNVSGYNFYRLLMGAEQAHIYYQAGVQPGLLDQKSVRSRFVEQLLWEREKKEKSLEIEGLIHTVTFPASPLPSVPPSIPVTDGIREALQHHLTEKGLSPSSLDTYMHCPKRFFFNYLSGVRPLNAVDEEGDKALFGSLLHDVLRDFLQPYVGVTTDLGDLAPEPLTEAFSRALHDNDHFSGLPLDTRMGLLKSGRYRLEQFLANQQRVTILSLEKAHKTTVHSAGLDIPFGGRLDRIDQREEDIIILDYKTGNAPIPKAGFWQDMELLDRMNDHLDGYIDPMFLPDLAKSVQSVQVPSYLYIYAKETGHSPANGGLIYLNDNGKENLLFSSRWTEEESAEAVDEITPLLIETLIHHLATATQFSAHPGTACRFCDFSNPCGYSPPKDKKR